MDWTPLEELARPKHSVCPSYTRQLFNPRTFRDVVEWAATQIVTFSQPSTPQTMGQLGIRAVAGCGHSGVLVAAAVAYRLNLPVIAVRKGGDTDGAHDSSDLNAVLEGTESYAIIDDLVASGRTMTRIVDEMETYFPRTRPTLVLLYHDSCTSSDRYVRGAHPHLENVTIVRKA